MYRVDSLFLLQINGPMNVLKLRKTSLNYKTVSRTHSPLFSFSIAVSTAG